MRYDAARRLTYYIVSAPKSEDCVKNFKCLLNMFAEDKGNTLGTTLSRHPLEAHVILSKILCESSQAYIGHFRQSMFAQVFLLCLCPLLKSADTGLQATRRGRAFRARDRRPKRLG